MSTIFSTKNIFRDISLQTSPLPLARASVNRVGSHLESVNGQTAPHCDRALAPSKIFQLSVLGMGNPYSTSLSIERPEVNISFGMII